MKFRYIFILSFFLITGFQAKGDTYPEVVFDNSLISGFYAKSRVNYSGGSWVENVRSHLPVSDTLFFTPGNALSLNYEQQEGGSWNALIRYSRQKFHYRLMQNDFLHLRIFVKSPSTKSQDLPRISIKQRGTETETLDIGDYISEYKVDTWIHVKIPISKFKNLNIEQPIVGIQFQESTLGKHCIMIDQIEFLSDNYSKAKLTSQALLTQATPYGQHIYLQWQMPLTPSIRYAKLYRSEDNENFLPVAIRPVTMRGSMDFVPIMEKPYYYKITWVDFEYNESPFSSVIETKANKMNDEQVMDMVQFSSINYFLENYDVNSGMHIPFQSKDKPIVSIRETGLAMVSLIIGVEKKIISRNIFLGRVKSILDFLEKVPNNHGIYASHYNGRTAAPHYLDDRPIYSIEATSSLIESLLVVRQYLSKSNPREVAIQERINKIWNKAEWSTFLVDGQQDILTSEYSIVDGLNTTRPLGGVNESMNTYLLAAASKDHAIPVSGFLNNLFVNDENSYISQDSLRTDTLLYQQHQNTVLDLAKDDAEPDSTINLSALQDTAVYGVRLPFGVLKNKSLLDLYRPFLTINPSALKIKDYDFVKILNDYSTYIKRRDNEYGLGLKNTDIWGYNGRDSTFFNRINPAISISTIVTDYTSGADALLSLHEQFGNLLLTEYGFRAWVDMSNYNVSEEYLSINQSSVAIMIENARTGLIWKLFAEIPEIKKVMENIHEAQNIE